MDVALSDLEIAKLLCNAKKYYSQTIYHLQQSFEKAIKSAYIYHRVKCDYISELNAYREAKQYQHNVKKSSLDLLIKISSIEEMQLQKAVSTETMTNPKYLRASWQLLNSTDGFKKRIKELKEELEPELKDVINTILYL